MTVISFPFYFSLLLLEDKIMNKKKRKGRKKKKKKKIKAIPSTTLVTSNMNGILLISL